MPQADGGRPAPKKKIVRKKGVGDAISGATKKDVSFGVRPEQRSANKAKAKSHRVQRKVANEIATTKPLSRGRLKQVGGDVPQNVAPKPFRLVDPLTKSAKRKAAEGERSTLKQLQDVGAKARADLNERGGSERKFKKRDAAIETLKTVKDLPGTSKVDQYQERYDAEQRKRRLKEQRDAKDKADKKKNPRAASDPNPTPKLQRAGVLPGSAPIGFLGKDAPLREPALKVLDIAARPLYAIANAKKQELINQGIGDPAKKGSVVKAAGRGLSGEDKTVGSDVLKQAGVKNRVVRAIGGTAYDLAVTAAYPGLRGGSLAKSGAEIAGEKAAKKATRRAAKRGASPQMAERMGESARKKAAEKAAKKRGVWLGVGYGKHGQVRIHHRTDRTIFRKGWMGEKPQPPSKVVDQVARVVRGPVSHVRPTVRKRGSSGLADHHLVRDIKREQRATIQKGRKTAQVRYDAVTRAVPPEHHAVVTHAMETRSLKGVPPELHDTVKKLIASQDHSLRRRKAVGLKADVGRSAETAAAAGGRAELKAQRGVVQRLETEANAKAGTTGSARDVTAHIKKMEAVPMERARVRKIEDAQPPKGYAMHIREEDLNTGNLDDPLAPGTGAGWTGKRRVKKTVQAQNAKAKPEDRLVEDPAALVANAESRDSRLIAARELAVKARGVGRPLPYRTSRVTGKRVLKGRVVKGDKVVGPNGKVARPGTVKLSTAYETGGVKSHEVVVHVGSDLRRLTDREVRALQHGDLKDLPTGGQYRVMAREHFDALTHTPVQTAGHWARYVTRPWKAVATATPAFQLRNLVGDEARVFDAGVPLHQIPRLNYQGAQAVHYMRQNEGAFGATAAGKTVNLGKSGSVSMKDWVKELERNGIFQSGIRNSELAHMGGDQMGHFGGRITSKDFPEWAARRQRFREEIDAIARESGHPLHELAKAFQNRENMTYATLYKHFRELGQGEREATRNTMDALIDYGDITDFERMLRNSVFPFYTFSARVVPFYAKTLLKRPGKIAFYEAVRQELGNLFGQNPDHLQYEAAYRQRLAGFPVAGKWVSMGLPVAQGLNELPTTLNPADYAKELLRYTFGVLSPWAKIPTELVPVIYGQPGFNFFFEAPLESPYSRFTPAPVVPGVPWEKIPKGTREKLGVKQIELRDGSLVWAWRGYKSYLLNVVTPGAPGFALRAGQDVSRRGQNKTQQWASFLTGIKIDNPDPIGAALGNAYSRKSLLEGMRSDIGQEKNGKNSPEYLKLSKQIKDLDVLINGLSRKRGDKKQLGHPPAKAKVRAKKQDGLGLDLSSGASDSGLGLDMSSGSSGSGLGLDLGS